MIELIEAERGLPGPLRESAWREVGGALAARGAKPAAWARFARRAGVAVFADSAQADAWLYLGFGAMDEDPRGAGRAFDMAERQGADPAEIARGRVLVSKPEPAPAQTRALARLLADQPGGGRPLAVWWALRVAHAASPYDGSAAAALEEARRLLDAAPRPVPGLETDLERMQVTLLAVQDPSRGLEGLDRYLEAHPKEVEAWRVRLDLSRGPQDAAAAARRAYEATGDSVFARVAEGLAGFERRAEAPAVGGAAGRAGACAAARLVRALRETGEWASTWDDLAADRAALDPDDRAALGRRRARGGGPLRAGRAGAELSAPARQGDRRGRPRGPR